MSKSKTKGAVKTRNQVAFAIALRGGDGAHADRRTRRNRDRSAQRRAAIREGASA